MVIKFYKACLLSVLCMAPLGLSADFEDVASTVFKEATEGTLGWASHAGASYIAYEGYKAYTGLTEDNGAEVIALLGGQALPRNELITLAGTVSSLAGTYYAASLWQYCTLGIQLRKMNRQNTSTNVILRNRWADYDTAEELMQAFNDNNGRARDPLKRQILLNMGLSENTQPLEAIEKVDAALVQLEERLRYYESYTNIVELLAQEMIDKDSDMQSLIGGDVLIDQDLNDYAEDLLQNYANNSFVANSITVGWFFKEDCYLKRPWIYTITYNIASRCALKTLEQYARLLAVRHILATYIPQNQRPARVVVNNQY